MTAQADAFRQALIRRDRTHRFMTARDQAAQAVRFAYRQRGKPYRWGGTGPYGYDCSGLVQRAWRSAGVYIPRVARSQYRRIHRKVRRSRLRSGDLIFFNGFGHVGMYVGNGRFIHSPRPGKTVRVARLRGHYARSMVGAVRPARPYAWRARRHPEPREILRRRSIDEPLLPGAPCVDSSAPGAGLDLPDGELFYCA